MKTGSLRRAMACAGAVVGAGFASGREITVFFSRYGMHSWWLIALTVWAMGRLCMKQMENSSVGMGRGAEICVMVLLSIAGGAMASAGGQMIALLWNHKWAYSIAVVGTLLLAWLAGSCRTELFSWAGSVLSCLLICAIMAAMAAVPDDSGALVLRSPSGGLLMAALKAAGYAAMNMTLAMDGQIWPMNAGELLVIRPPEKLPIGRTEKDPEKLRAVYEIGRRTAAAKVMEIKTFLGQN